MMGKNEELKLLKGDKEKGKWKNKKESKRK